MLHYNITASRPGSHVPHDHSHRHGAAAPHPPQAAALSILRMTLAARLGAAVLVCAGLWALVWVAMR